MRRHVVRLPANPYAALLADATTGPPGFDEVVNLVDFRARVREYLAAIGQRGGSVSSPRKYAASIISLAAARAAKQAKAAKLKQGADRRVKPTTSRRSK